MEVKRGARKKFKLSVKQEREITQVFDMFDTGKSIMIVIGYRLDVFHTNTFLDGSGHISGKELRTAMWSLGFNPSKAEVAELLDEMDEDGNGTVEIDEVKKV